MMLTTRYDKSMTVVKLTVSLDDDLVAEVRQQVADGHASSVSAWLNAAARNYLEQTELKDVLAEIFAETGGPLTDDELQAARATLAAAEVQAAQTGDQR